jgi:hypothetical protein
MMMDPNADPFAAPRSRRDVQVNLELVYSRFKLGSTVKRIPAPNVEDALLLVGQYR